MRRIGLVGRSASIALSLGALASAAQAGFFPTTLSENTTGLSDSIFVGAPDDNYVGIGGQIVAYDFGAQAVVNRVGAVDFNVYEVDFGSPEFTSMSIYVSADGVTYFNISAFSVAVVRIAGDEAHGNNSFARSYDLESVGLATARFIRIDGNGSGSAGGNTGFDLDAIGAHEVTPVPEPATTALMLAGLGALGFIARRRQTR